MSEEEDERELAESVRTISALFQSGNNASLDLPSTDEALEVRVASISAEIAAAIAQAQSRGFAEVDEEDEESGSGSGQEIGALGLIGPNTSDVRGEDEGGRKGSEEDDSDTLSASLRTRGVPVSGTKRKR